MFAEHLIIYADNLFSPASLEHNIVVRVPKDEYERAPEGLPNVAKMLNARA